MAATLKKLCWLSLLALLARPAIAAEYQDTEEVAPESAEESSVGLDRLEIRKELGPAKELFKNALANAPPYWRDTRGSLKIRTFDFRRTADDVEIADAFAGGFELDVQSGKWLKAFSFDVTWHTSYGIRTPDGLGNTGVLLPDQSDISVISRAFGQWSFTEKTRVRLGRQDFNIPYINRQDSRMIPTTYEAFVYEHLGEKFQSTVGHVDKVKKRDSDEFVPMGQAAGVDDNNSGTSLLGLRYKWNSGFSIGALAQHTRDLYVTTYSETSFGKTLSDKWGMQLTAQLSNQWSIGNELLGEFDTYAWGLRGRLSYRGAVLTLAGTRSGNAQIRSPFGGSPSYTVPMIGDFDRAHERTWRVGISQNFAAYNVPGFSISVKYTAGSSAVASDGTPIPDADELDVTADFRPESGILKGVWLRLRWGHLDRGPGLRDREDVRLILNYTLSAFD